MDVCECALCDQIAGNPAGDLLYGVLGGPYKRRIILENAHFAVIPSIGPLAVGHVLLVPKTHLRRLADVPFALHSVYESFLTETVSLLEQTFVTPIHRFEHGSNTRATKIPCTVAHAHLHLLPARLTLWGRLTEEYEWEQTARAALQRAVGTGEYLYYESPEGRAGVVLERPGGFPSQYLRQLFAEQLGVAEWNWRKDARAHQLAETYARLTETARMTV